MWIWRGCLSAKVASPSRGHSRHVFILFCFYALVLKRLGLCCLMLSGCCQNQQCASSTYPQRRVRNEQVSQCAKLVAAISVKTEETGAGPLPALYCRRKHWLVVDGRKGFTFSDHVHLPSGGRFESPNVALRRRPHVAQPFGRRCAKCVYSPSRIGPTPGLVRHNVP